MNRIQRGRPEREAIDEYDDAVDFNEMIMNLPEQRREEMMQYYHNDLVDPRTAAEAVNVDGLPIGRQVPDAVYRNAVLQMRADNANPDMVTGIAGMTRQQMTFRNMFNRPRVQPEIVTPQPSLRQMLLAPFRNISNRQPVAPEIAPEPQLRRRLAQAIIPQATPLDNMGRPVDNMGIPILQATPVDIYGAPISLRRAERRVNPNAGPYRIPGVDEDFYDD